MEKGISHSPEESLRLVQQNPDFVELKPSAGLALELRYAQDNNFLGRKIYGAFDRAFLHRIAAEKLTRAVKALRQKYPSHSFLIYDALRPRSVQYLLWDAVVGTANEKYIANPARGSLHNFGFAVDLTLVDDSQKPLDMGTQFDDFTRVSEPRHEEEFLRSGQLTAQQFENRKLLRGLMEDAGFLPLAIEWWHFDALDPALVRRDYRLVE